MSAIKMLKPADGIEGIKEFVVDCVATIELMTRKVLCLGSRAGGSVDR